MRVYEGGRRVSKGGVRVYEGGGRVWEGVRGWWDTTSEIAISRVLRSVHCRLHTFFLDIDLARFDSEKLCVLSKI